MRKCLRASSVSGSSSGCAKARGAGRRSPTSSSGRSRTIPEYHARVCARAAGLLRCEFRMRHVPTLEGFREAARTGNLVAVYRELICDGDTPVSAYAKLRQPPHSFLLESVVGGEKWAAYSFLGVGARAVVRARGGRWEVV